VCTAALNVLSLKEKELVKLLGDALEGCELRNIQQHKRPDTATALERTSIATDMALDLYHILEGLLASDPRCLKVGSEQEPNAPEVDLHLFTLKGTYICLGESDVRRSCGYEEGVGGAGGTAYGEGRENGEEKSEKGGQAPEEGDVNWGCMSKETAFFFS
jgi:hypothetical protein